MKKILSSILVLLFSCSGAEEAKDTLSYDYEAVEETQGETPCQEKEQFCDGDQAVECIGGQYQYHKCGEKEFCNFGKCAGIHVAFPKDAASHDVVMEWWYYTGHLTDGAGEWGFQVTIFKVNEDFFGATGYMCHVAVIDKKSKEHYYSYSLTSVADMWTDSPAEFMVNECHLKLDGAGTDAVRAAIPEGEEGNGKKGGWEIDISLETEKKAAYHGTDGIVRMGSEGNDSYYYSYTRMNAQGELTTPDGKRAVTGQGWMDHQWGMFDINAFKGWDWWSMQFEDGYEVMLFQFRDWSDNLVHQAGTISDPQGNLTWFEGMESFTVKPLRQWKSPHTEGIYPLDWDVSIEPMEWEVQVRTDIDDQEMPNIAQNYWEGAVTISGKRGSDDVNGVGFVELTGYAKDLMDPGR